MMAKRSAADDSPAKYHKKTRKDDDVADLEVSISLINLL